MSYKVIAKHFAELISVDVAKSCSVNQFGFIHGRLMSNCSNTLIGMIDRLRLVCPKSFLLFADISAAFDCAILSVFNHLLDIIFPKSGLAVKLAWLAVGSEAHLFPLMLGLVKVTPFRP